MNKLTERRSAPAQSGAQSRVPEIRVVSVTRADWNNGYSVKDLEHALVFLKFLDRTLEAFWYVPWVDRALRTKERGPHCSIPARIVLDALYNFQQHLEALIEETKRTAKAAKGRRGR